MKPTAIGLLACACTAAALILVASSLRAADEPAIDFNRVRQLFEKRKSGETLTADEQAYVQRAMQMRAKQQKGGNPSGSENASAKPVSDPKIVASLVPLDELQGSYKGEDGGLYGGGKNLPPESHLAAYRRASEQIQPLDAEGQPADDGKIVLLSLGMSNSTMEFSEFVKVAKADAKKSPKVAVVDGAIGARTATVWALDGAASLAADETERLEKLMQDTNRKARPEPDTWPTVEKRLKENGVTPRQVQAIWLKQAEAMPAKLGDFPKHAQVLEENIIDMITIAKERYPNLRVVFLSSRIFGGYATTFLNPEPYAYEEAFSMRWVIQKQMKGEPRLAYDKAPVVVWGPYLWGNGTTPRKSDGLVWKEEDFVTTDHTHPSQSARQKVADLLIKFFENDPAAQRWFVGAPVQASK